VPSGLTAGTEVRGISTVMPLKIADDLMAVYINEKQELRSVLQFEIHFSSAFFSQIHTLFSDVNIYLLLTQIL
jgi:hypothetical protein